VQEIPFDDIPNASNLVPELVNPSWDPDGSFSLPWQSGMTGIAYNISATGRELTSMADLFDPEFAGRIGMLTEMRDTVGLLLLLEGVDPAEATIDSAEPAFARLEAAKDDGTIRQFTGNDYMDDLASGNFAACIGWSGDISQLALDNPDLRFVIPDEGGMQWSDTMVLPNGASNVAAAARWMDFVYDPENAARITAYVGYNSPVAGVQEILAASDDEFEQALAESPLLFPDDATLERLHIFKTLDEEEEAAFDERFSSIVGA
jgi:spermidine/putrescine transport system substrate-binding protein